MAALLLGAVGFACGFFGPIALNPEANQGPLLGIFITGPLGFLLGGGLGLLAAATKLSTQAFLRLLTTASVVGGAAVLFASLPDDQALGFVIDAEVVECGPPTSRLEEARGYWERALAAFPGNRQRVGWREDIPAMAARDPGAVVTLQVHRRWDVREHRKPWNRGELVVRDRGPRGRERYFVEGANACAGLLPGARERYAPAYEYASVSPPDKLPAFLNLHVLGPVPERFRTLLP